MILVRHDPSDDGVQRIVLFGRLERSDASGLLHLTGLPGLPGLSGPVGSGGSTGSGGSVRMIVSKLWLAEPAAVDGLITLGADLAVDGVACWWVGCLPEVAAALALAGLGGSLAPAGQEDVRAGASWDGIPPFQLAPATR